jgi:hypothetical protein
MTSAIHPATKLTVVPRLSFQHDIGSEYQITPLRTVRPTAETSSDTEVVGDLLAKLVADRHSVEIPNDIPVTAKSVLNLYLHAQFCMILPYWNHIGTVADCGKRYAQLLR